MKLRFPALILLLLAGTAAAGAATPQDISEDGAILRSCMHDLVAASCVGSAPEPDGLRRAIASHPKVLQWILEGRDLDPILEAADLKQSIGGGLGIPANLRTQLQASPLAASLAGQIPQSSFEERMQMLARLPDAEFITMGGRIRTDVDALDLSKTEAVRMLSEPRTSLGITDETLAGLLEKVLPRYFADIDRIDKTTLVLGQLKLRPGAAQADQLGALLMGSGPCLQKLFQLVGKDVQRPDLAQTMQALQNDIKPFGFDEFRRAVEKASGRTLEESFASVDPTPLAAASVGQVHRGVLKDGSAVAIKVRRPGLGIRAEREIRGLRAAASSEPMALELLTRVGKTVMEEMDFRNEARNLEEGLRYVDPSRGIWIAGRMEAVPVAEDLLVSRLASGAKLSKFDPTDLGQVAVRARAIEKLLDSWFDEAIFGSGFFHGDLHPGNIFFKESLVDPGFELTLIDFGNAGRLSLDERRGFVQLVLAAQGESPLKVLDTLQSLGKVPEARRQLMLAGIEQILKDPGTVDVRLDRILVLALENGLEVPGGFVAFNRGRAFLEKELISLSKLLGRLDTRGLNRIPSVEKIYRNLTLKRVSRSLVGGLFMPSIRTTQVVTPGMLAGALGDKLSLAGRRLGDTCMEASRSLAGESAPR